MTAARHVAGSDNVPCGAASWSVVHGAARCSGFPADFFVSINRRDRKRCAPRRRVLRNEPSRSSSAVAGGVGGGSGRLSTHQRLDGCCCCGSCCGLSSGAAVIGRVLPPLPLLLLLPLLLPALAAGGVPSANSRTCEMMREAIRGVIRCNQRPSGRRPFGQQSHLKAGSIHIHIHIHAPQSRQPATCRAARQPSSPAVAAECRTPPP